MILPYLYLFLVFPVLVGILSVDNNGEPFSTLDYIRDRFAPMDIDNIEEGIQTVEEPDEGFLNSTNAIEPDGIILPDNIAEGMSAIWDALWFLGSQSKDLGTWIGISSAPFHYVIAFAIAVFAIFLQQMFWIIGFFYLLITEFDEFKNIRRKDVI